MGDWNQAVIEEFRANDGKVGGPFENMDLLLLHTTGAKSGAQRVNPVAYTRYGDRYVILASKGGAPSNPDWFYNLAANPEVEVEVGKDEFKARASIAPEPERTELYQRMAAKYSAFADYERKASRVIPVVILERIS